MHLLLPVFERLVGSVITSSASALRIVGSILAKRQSFKVYLRREKHVYVLVRIPK